MFGIRNILDLKKFSVQKNLDPKNFELKELWDEKKIWSQTISGSKYFGRSQFGVQQKFGVQK